MTINRRHFLTATGGSIAGGLLSATQTASSLSSSEPIKSELIANLHDWSAVRNQFELSRTHIHMSSFFLSSHPRQVRDAIERHQRAIDRNPYLYVDERWLEMPNVVRASAADYLGANATEVGLTNSTTMGLSFVYQGLPISAGQEIVTTTGEHYVHDEAIRLAAERAGATVRKISLFEDVNSISEEEIVQRIEMAVGPRTRAVGVTWVYSGTGLKVPVRRIAEALARINASRDEAERVLLIVDGLHGLGVEDETVADMGCDFFVSGTHKWMFGPRGTGVIWAKPDDWKRQRQTFPAIDARALTAWLRGETPQGMEGTWISPGGFHAFEYAWALPAAFDFHKRIGRSRIAERIHTLNDQAKEELARMPRVTLHTPRGHALSAGIICFDVQGMSAAEVVHRLLARRIIASTSPYPAPCVRIAPSLVNSPQEVDTTLREIHAIASAG